MSVERCPALPMPRDEFDEGQTIVVASCWLDDEYAGERGPLALLLTMGQYPPYYAVGQIEWKGPWTWVHEPSHHMNINHAVAAFADSGGDV